MAKDGIHVRGMFRIRLGEDNPDGSVSVVGDSGWQDNQITDLGFQDYICKSIGAVAASKQIGSIAIGTGAAPASDATAIANETIRTACAGAVVGSTTLRMTATIASGDQPGACTINNAGLVNGTASDGTFLCGNTYATSAWATNQGLSATYDLVFS
ncbi:MAG: hypothetical protein MIO92_09835 [Methanosarcinaceae archaeon]|nr:hypothetical protein [Methanosarcinaceae archaeon]